MVGEKRAAACQGTLAPEEDGRFGRGGDGAADEGPVATVMREPGPQNLAALLLGFLGVHVPETTLHARMPKKSSHNSLVGDSLSFFSVALCKEFYSTPSCVETFLQLCKAVGFSRTKRAEPVHIFSVENIPVNLDDAPKIER